MEGCVDNGIKPFGEPSVLDFHGKMHRNSRIMVYAHTVISTFAAISYTFVSILITSGWRTETSNPLCPLFGGFTANMILTNLLAVAVNVSLCLGALLVVGFTRCRLLFVQIWFWGQLGVEILLTGVLIAAVALSCKTAAILSIPPFLYFVVSITCYRQLSASVSYQNNYCSK